MLKYLYYFILSLILVLLAQSLLPAFLNTTNLNVILVFLVFATFVWGLELGFFLAIFMGLFQGWYSYLPFGSLILINIVIVYFVEYLHRQIFINFTFITNMILIIASTLSYSLLLGLVSYLALFFGLIKIHMSLDAPYFFNLAEQLVLNFGLMALFFVIAKAIYKKLNLAVLAKR